VDFPKATDIEYDVFSFSGSSALTTVSFGAVTSISISFSGCTALTTVDFPKATSIGDYTFRDCTALTIVSFPEVTSIGYQAFSGCTSLATVDFPAVTDIGYGSFYGCTALTTASFPAVTSIGRDAFYNTGNAPLTIYLPKAAPSVIGSNLSSDTYSKTVTIRTPADRTGFDSAWHTSFQDTFGLYVDITLVFEEL
jgi:hypothetical protein